MQDTRHQSLPTSSVSAPDRTLIRALTAAERNSRRLAEALWALADVNGCYCAHPTSHHERKCSDARSALVLFMEAK